MSDVLLYQTDDDAEIAVTAGEVRMTEGPETAAYISLFGGNDNGSAWWGDQSITSATQAALYDLPPSSGNLRRIEDAAAEDLAWMAADPYGWDVTVSATIPALNRVKLVATINGVPYEFAQEWTA